MYLVAAGMKKKVEELTSDMYFDGADAKEPTDMVLERNERKMTELIREEAIALCDQIIGKDRVIHSDIDLAEGVERMEEKDKAVFDFQVKQRISLAKYQNGPQVNGPTGPEDVINTNLSPNEE